MSRKKEAVTITQVQAVVLLSKRFPWATSIGVSPPHPGANFWHVEAECCPDSDGHLVGGGVDCYGRGPTLKDAVDFCVKAWPVKRGGQR